ncbi:hypothetical protein IKG60_01485, partial [Candidatus Saccharibacteria bacterium]|nr:hypothetical protein [Candidatus Saccharibacteria bacterium]
GTSGEMPAFRADGVGSGSVTVGDGGGVIGGDGSGPVVVIANVGMVTDFGSTGGDAGSEEVLRGYLCAMNPICFWRGLAAHGLSAFIVV